MQSGFTQIDELICPYQIYLRALDCMQRFEYVEACEGLSVAIKVEPFNFHYWDLYAQTLYLLGQRNESLQAYKFVATLYNNSTVNLKIGQIHQELHHYEASLQAYTQAISQDPHNFESYNLKGNLLRFLKSYPEAIYTFVQGISQCGPNEHLYNNLGNCFTELSMLKDASLCYNEALKVKPSLVAAHCNLSSVLKAEGKIHEAIFCCSQALNIDPGYSDAYACMGNILKDTADFKSSIMYFSQAVKLNPKSVSSLVNLANCLKDSGDAKIAVFYYEKALEIVDWHPEAFSNMVYSKIFICDWRDIKENFTQLASYIKSQIDNNQVPAVQPFHTFVYPLAPEDKLIISKKYAEYTGSLVSQFKLYPTAPLNSKIRVGYVSSDFVDHPLCHLMQNVFAMHDRSCFEVYTFALTPDDQSEYRARVRAGSDFFIDLSSIKDSKDLSSEVYKHRIDVLFNLNGYTRGSRNEIFALRPGRVQISYMGFAGTMGADYLEYLVTDQKTSPPSLVQLYSEKLIWMPHSYFVNDHLQSAKYVLGSDRPCRKGLLPEDKFVFANFNQLYKIDPDTFEIWMRILKRVPNSVLWLLRFPPAGEENIKKQAALNGIDPLRIVFTDVAHKKEHINRCFLADLCLDTPLCNGHTTTCDLLWSGLPMITLPLKTMASRVASGLCFAVRMPEFVVSSSEEYEETAVRLANGVVDKKLDEQLPEEYRTRLGSTELKELRYKLNVNKTVEPCFNTKLWVKNLEKALKVVVKLQIEGHQPKHIEVIDD